jgi:GldM C-terminal domain
MKNKFKISYLAIFSIATTLLLSACGGHALSDADVQSLASKIDSMQVVSDLLKIRATGDHERILQRLDSLQTIGDPSFDWVAATQGKLEKATATMRTQLEEDISSLNQFAEHAQGSMEFGNPNEHSRTQKYLFGDGSGAIHSIRARHNIYVQEVQDLCNARRAALGDVKLIDFLKDPGPDQKWETAEFKRSNAIESVLKLETMRMEVLAQERAIRDAILKAMGLKSAYGDGKPQTGSGKEMNIKCEPVAKKFAAGMKMEAKVSIENLPLEAVPSYAGTSLLIDDDDPRTATVKVTAPGGFANGQTQKQYLTQLSASVKTLGGKEVKLTGECDFTIMVPEAVITPSPDMPLYRECGNKLTVDAPSLGEYYAPKFTSTQAQILPSSTDKRMITIVPIAKTTVLGVSSLTNGQNIAIGNFTFQVRATPLPKLILSADGEDISSNATISKSSNLKVRVKPDAAFQSAMPKDARYAIPDVEIYKESSGAKTKIAEQSGNGKDATLGISLDNKAFAQLPSGTKILIIVPEVYRMNFQNRRIEESMDSPTRTFSVTLR